MDSRNMWMMGSPADDDVELGAPLESNGIKAEVSPEIRAIISKHHNGVMDLVDAAVEAYDKRRAAFCRETGMSFKDFDGAMAGNLEAIYNAYNSAVISRATTDADRDAAFNRFEGMFDDLTFLKFSGWWTTETKNQKRTEMLLASNQTPFEVSASTRERVLGAYGPANDDVDKGDNLARAA